MGAHASIEEARAGDDADGTRSILDRTGVADSPRAPGRETFTDDPIESGPDEDEMLGLVAPPTPRQLVLLFGTERPTRAMIEANDDYYGLLDRGLGISIIAHDGDRPSEIFFAGYSYD